MTEDIKSNGNSVPCETNESKAPAKVEESPSNNPKNSSLVGHESFYFFMDSLASDPKEDPNNVALQSLSPSQRKQFESLHSFWQDLLDKYWPSEHDPSHLALKYRTQYNGSTVRRFMRTKEFNLEEAQKAMEHFSKWRHTNDFGHGIAGVLAITEATISDTIKAEKGRIFGYDRQKRRVVWISAKNHDVSNSNLDEMKRFAVLIFENALSTTGSTDDFCVVFDLNGFSLKNMDYKMLTFALQLYVEFYPDAVGSILILNAPWIFNGIWRIIKGWVPPKLASRVNFVDKSKLLEFVPSESFPPNFDASKENNIK